MRIRNFSRGTEFRTFINNYDPFLKKNATLVQVERGGGQIKIKAGDSNARRRPPPPKKNPPLAGKEKQKTTSTRQDFAALFGGLNLVDLAGFYIQPGYSYSYCIIY